MQLNSYIVHENLPQDFKSVPTEEQRCLLLAAYGHLNPASCVFLENCTGWAPGIVREPLGMQKSG